MADDVAVVRARMEAADEPYGLFAEWMAAAKESELNDPDAMSLATATAEGVPSVRMVLLKRVDSRGFGFFTNGESRKGEELRANAHAALCLHWKSLRRQVRVEGSVTELPTEDVDEYFASRGRRSKVGAWASQQSRPLGSRAELEEKARGLDQQFGESVPRPPYWTGFLVSPVRIEFWQDGEARLHDRIVFTADGAGSWTKERLYP